PPILVDQLHPRANIHLREIDSSEANPRDEYVDAMPNCWCLSESSVGDRFGAVRLRRSHTSLPRASAIVILSSVRDFEWNKFLTSLGLPVEPECGGLVVALQHGVDAMVHPPIAGGGFRCAGDGFALDPGEFVASGGIEALQLQEREEAS